VSRALPLPIQVYRTSIGLLEPAAAGLLAWRRRRGLEEAARIGERQGYPGRARPAGPLVWIHGASIGESLSLLPIVERIAQRGVNVLVTSGTRTSANLLARRLPPGAFHQFIPLDVPRYMRRFLDHWRPDLALFAESEIWPNTVLEIEARGVPLVLVNGRISDRTFRRWQRLPTMIGALLGRYDLCLAQSAVDAERLAHLGAPRVAVSGNLKFDTPPPAADPRMVAQLSGMVAGRPVWLAASTHPGEDEAVIAAHQALAARWPGLLTIIAPRHPQRGADIAGLVRQAGLAGARRSAGHLPERGTDVYVADTVGEMGLLYRLSPVVFVGGSLVPHGGQNPIEPAKLGAAIVHGEHVHNQRDPYAALHAAGGAEVVADEEELAAAIHRLLADPARTRAMARAAADAVNAIGGAVERTMQSIEPFIVPLKRADAR
jgi:3-deoxy-D-manno-octulosonic-acid transferase